MKVTALMLLASGAKHERFEASSNQASELLLKVSYKLPQYRTIIATMDYAVRPGAHLRILIALELKKLLGIRLEEIYEVPKEYHAVHLTKLGKTRPSARSKCSTHSRTSLCATARSFSGM